MSDLFRGDGGVPAAFLGGGSNNTSDFQDALAGATTSGGGPVPVQDTQNFGTIGSPARQGRFDEPERLEGIPRGDVRGWLAVAGGWALRCLERVPLVPPFEAPVRFTVTRDGTVAGVASEGLSEAALSCLVEGFGHARFNPVPRPTELVARYRYTVRGSLPRGSVPGRAP